MKIVSGLGFYITISRSEVKVVYVTLKFDLLFTQNLTYRRVVLAYSRATWGGGLIGCHSFLLLENNIFFLI